MFCVFNFRTPIYICVFLVCEHIYKINYIEVNISQEKIR